MTFALDVAPGLPTVTADPTYVEQVVRNLLSNAAKYGGAGLDRDGRRRLERRGRGDGEVLVRVLDDGPGFPADETSRLFELFYRSPGPPVRRAAPASGCSSAPG